uniref:RNA exonuclease 4 n=1 Tax=Anthurium amnicola TaxID=1678845 RepID=A0A1D1ZHS4_9ARAE
MGGSTANPSPSPMNPNWALLQQRLRAPDSGASLPDSGEAGKPPSALGKRKERPGSNPASTSTVSAPLTPSDVLKPTCTDCSLTDALAMDCEMVGVGSQGNKSAIGRITLVNAWGNAVYDEYVRPLEHVVDFRTRISGIRARNLRKAKNYRTAQKEVAELIKGRILVGHALHNDLKAMLLGHPKHDIRDTSEYQPFLSREGRRRALRDLAAQILGIRIQQGMHCSVEDARAAMLIYQKNKKEWEKSIKKQFKLKKKLKKGRKRNKQKKESMNFDDQGAIS